MSSGRRLTTLDAMRGAGALAVVLYHLPVFPARWAPSGYLAVDFFFLLSGFVVARAYDAPMRSGMAFAEFVRVRLIRLYPLFALGLAIGLARAIGQLALQRPDRLHPYEIVVALCSNALLLPSPGTASISPLNGPGWSLILEFGINVAYALMLVRLPIRALGAIVLGSALLLVLTAWEAGSLGIGTTWATLPGGIARVTYSFTLGMVLARVHHRVSNESYAFALPLAALLIAFVVDPGPHGRLAYDLVFALVLAPSLVWMGASVNAPASLRDASAALGDLSYPLYAVHYPAMWVAGYAARKAGLPDALWMSMFVVGIAAASLALHHAVDVPVRKRLLRWSAARRERMAIGL